MGSGWLHFGNRPAGFWDRLPVKEGLQDLPEEQVSSGLAIRNLLMQVISPAIAVSVAFANMFVTLTIGLLHLISGTTYLLTVNAGLHQFLEDQVSSRPTMRNLLMQVCKIVRHERRSLYASCQCKTARPIATQMPSKGTDPENQQPKNGFRNLRLCSPGIPLLCACCGMYVVPRELVTLSIRTSEWCMFSASRTTSAPSQRSSYLAFALTSITEHVLVWCRLFRMGEAYVDAIFSRSCLGCCSSHPTQCTSFIPFPLNASSLSFSRMLMWLMARSFTGYSLPDLKLVCPRLMPENSAKLRTFHTVVVVHASCGQGSSNF